MDNERIIRYQVWFNEMSHTDELFDDMDEAIAYARENNGIEVEQLIWNSEESYEDDFADEFKIVWSAN